MSCIYFAAKIDAAYFILRAGPENMLQFGINGPGSFMLAPGGPGCKTAGPCHLYAQDARDWSNIFSVCCVHSVHNQIQSWILILSPSPKNLKTCSFFTTKVLHFFSINSVQIQCWSQFLEAICSPDPIQIQQHLSYSGTSPMLISDEWQGWAEHYFLPRSKSYNGSGIWQMLLDLDFSQLDWINTTKINSNDIAAQSSQN